MTIRMGHGSGNQRAEIQLGRIWPVWVSSQQTASRCQGLRCHTGCCRCHTTGSFCQTANQTRQRLSWWEAWIDAPFQIKEFQLAGIRRAKGSNVLLLSMLWFIYLLFCVSLCLLQRVLCTRICWCDEKWLVEYCAPTTLKLSISFSIDDNLLFDHTIILQGNTWLVWKSQYYCSYTY